jgi:hypothetical protein
MQIRSADLDLETRDYLRTIWTTRGAGVNGVFLLRPASGFAGRVVLAILLLGVVGLLCLPAAAGPGRAPWQAALTGLAVVCVVSAVQKGRALARNRDLGSFWFFDARYFWDVSPARVVATAIDRVSSVCGTNHYQNWVYQGTTLAMVTPEGVVQRTVRDLSRAEELARFINALIACRDAPGNEAVRNDPALLGAVAINLARGIPSISGADLNLRDVPQPRARSSVAARSGRFVAPLVGAGVAAALGLFLFPVLGDTIRESHLFAQVPTQDTQSTLAFDEYLKEYPQGWRAAEVMGRRDDLLWGRAHNAASRDHSPAELRKYLADRRNRRHRAEAQKLINAHYDQAIARLKGLNAGETEGKKIDTQMFGGLLALLEALKTADRPVVTVGFKATQDEAPVTEVQKQMEKLESDLYAAQNPQVKTMAEFSPRKTAILPTGATFSAEQTARRERLILERLRESMRKVLKTDILSLEAAPRGVKPTIEVAYRTYAPGMLYLYTTEQRAQPFAPAWQPPGGGFGMPGGQRPGGFGMGLPQKIVKGLLRGYHHDWTITIHPPGGGEPRVARLQSSPAQDLKYDTRPGDPEWGAYAVILYSGFHDMSNRLIASFGLQPPPAPTVFTFDDAVKR